MNHKNLLFLILLSLLSFNISAQHYVAGNVVNTISKKKLPYVKIIVNNDKKNTFTTDAMGNFGVSSDKEIEFLQFSCSGYENEIVFVIDFNEKLQVEMKPKTFDLKDKNVLANHKKALRIIDSVMKYKDSNNINNLDSYYYKGYNNFSLYSDTTKTDDPDLKYYYCDGYHESVYEEFHKKPHKDRRNFIARYCDVSDVEIVTHFTEKYHSTNFYEDFINIYDIKHINPISKTGSAKYVFQLNAAYTDNNNDSIFEIAFLPRDKALFNAIKGRYFINSNKWGIQYLEIEPVAQISNEYDIKITQDYELIDGEHWFHTATETILTSKSNLIKGFEIKGYAKLIGSNTDIKINPDIDNKVFGRFDYYADDTDRETRRKIAKELRPDSLDKVISKYSYVILADSTTEHAGALFDAIVCLQHGYLPVSIFNFKISDLFNYNISNGLMLGLGGYTNNKLSKVFSIGGFGNYWFKAKKPNYGANISFNLSRKTFMKLDLGYSHKFEKIGLYGFNDNDFIIVPSNFKELFTKSTSLNTTIGLIYSTYINKYMKFIMRYDISQKIHYGFGEENLEYKYNFSKLEFKLRIGFNELGIFSTNSLNVLKKANPVLWVSYQKNFENTFGSPYKFDKLQLQFEGTYANTYLGETNLLIQSGIINGIAPVTELFNIYASGSGKVNLFTKGSFNTMAPNEFFCDRFFTAFFTHNFSTKVVDFRRYHPEFILVTNIGFGDLRRGNEEELDIDYNDMSKGYFESGIIINNIVRNQSTKYGIGIFYRYGEYAMKKAWDNFFFKLSIDFKI